MTVSRGIKFATRLALSPETVREIFDYDPLIGALLWKKDSVKVKAGERIGCPDAKGRRRTTYNYKNYLVSRLIWLWWYGKWPENEIDHIDLDSGNDRIENLRDITHQQNMANTFARARNNTGIKGVHYDRRRGKYKATIMKDGKTINLGRFDYLDQAEKAYKTAAKELFGAFSRT